MFESSSFPGAPWRFSARGRAGAEPALRLGAAARMGISGFRRARALVAGLLSGLVCGACSSSGGEPWVSAPAAGQPADVTVLMMGNSHTSAHDLPQQLDAMLRAGLPGRTVATAVAPGWLFLDERLADVPSMQLLASRPWRVVVLQAQKYSRSGQFSHSTSEAVALVRHARSVGALPVLFPEWPRRGVAETRRIHELHLSIARTEPACVAPVGQAWDLAAQRFPALELHAADGNHAAPAGAYLAALVLYATVTGASPLGLPDQANGVAPAVQAQLRQVAADAVQATPSRQFCPADRPLGAASPGLLARFVAAPA